MSLCTGLLLFDVGGGGGRLLGEAGTLPCTGNDFKGLLIGASLLLLTGKLDSDCLPAAGAVLFGGRGGGGLDGDLSGEGSRFCC